MSQPLDDLIAGLRAQAPDRDLSQLERTVWRAIAGSLSLAPGAMKDVNLHMIADDVLMNELSAESKLSPTPRLLERLKAAGRVAADRFLKNGGSKIGEAPSADLKEMLG